MEAAKIHRFNNNLNTATKTDQDNSLLHLVSTREPVTNRTQGQAANRIRIPLRGDDRAATTAARIVKQPKAERHHTISNRRLTLPQLNTVEHHNPKGIDSEAIQSNPPPLTSVQTSVQRSPFLIDKNRQTRSNDLLKSHNLISPKKLLAGLQRKNTTILCNTHTLLGHHAPDRLTIRYR